jgi:hypothetical protein
LAKVSGIRSKRMIQAFIVLLRNTTWKCGSVERRVVDYLRRQKQCCGYAPSSVTDLLEHFEVQETQHQRFFEAMQRLERRGIIKVMFKPFSISSESTVMFS